MKFSINHELLAQSRASLSKRKKLFWIVGGAGSGKTTISKALAAKFEIPIYDMDAQIYGVYHGRYSQDRHPVNKAWSTAENGLAFLLDMSMDEFNHFNQAVLPEYMDLLAEDLASTDPDAGILIDGGISNPAIVAQVISPHQIICLTGPERSSAEIWEGSDERRSMKEYIYQLPNPEEAWRKFLEFDENINQTILKESQENGISICSRSETESVDDFAKRVANILGIQQHSQEAF